MIDLCEICGKEAFYKCGKCEVAAYCSNEHQIEDWKSHKQVCKMLKKYRENRQQNQLLNKRLKLRNKYFEYFSYKIYDQCIQIVMKLLELQKSIVQTTKEINNQFEYGCTVTLLCRTYIILNDKCSAEIQINEYLKEKKHFLQDLRDIVTLKEAETKKKSKEFMDKKLALISAISNILYQLKISPIDYYIIYLSHIEKFFGQRSPQVSNCYFMIGCYFAEQNSLQKAIACFTKSAIDRTVQSSDCYFNIAILVQFQGKTVQAIDIMEYSISLVEAEFGESSIQVAESNQCLAYLYSANRNYNAALKCLEKSFRIRQTKPNPESSTKITNQIKVLYNNLKMELEGGQIPVQLQKYATSIMQNIAKKKMVEEREMDREQINDKEKREDIDMGRMNLKIPQNDEIKLIISDSLLKKLSKNQIMSLSELQLELQNCKTDYSVANTVRISHFFNSITDKIKLQLKNENKQLFEILNLQKHTAIKFDKNQDD